jgi:hypothetical protein
MNVERIRLIEVRGTIFGDENDPVLWEIRPESPDRPLTSVFLRAGRVPEGFIETVPYESTVTRSLGWYVLTTGVDSHREFDYDELREGWFLNYKDDYLTEEEFVADAHCV